jgi:Uma2 family endonuclease
MSTETETIVSFQHGWTTDMVERMPRVEGERYEIIGGELYVTTAPHIRHQMTCSQIVTELNLWARQTQAGVAVAAPGLIYAADDAVIPDVVWMSKGRMAAIVGQDGKLHGSPDLVVEVLSPGKANAERDREKKLDLYERYGVLEYWIVDWQTTTIDVYRQVDEQLQLIVTLNAADTVTSPLLPEFSCPVERMFNF